MSACTDRVVKQNRPSCSDVSGCVLMPRQPFPTTCQTNSALNRTWGNPGGKSYRQVEHSPDFYKFGSTVPAAIFSKSFMENKAMTFIPVIAMKKTRDRVSSLCAMPPKSSVALDREEVARLERWIAAPPLTPANSGSRRSLPTSHSGHGAYLHRESYELKQLSPFLKEYQARRRGPSHEI